MSMMVAVLLAALAAVVVATAVFRHFVPLLRNPGVPRGSFGWPIIGETLGFLRPHAANTTSAFLQDHITRYGPVFKSHLFGTPTVVSCDAELNHFVLQNEERLFQSSYPGSVRGILGETSMLVVTGEHYRRLRSIFVSLVSSIRVRPSYLADVDQAACRTIASWRGRRAFTFMDEAKKLAFSVIIEQVLGLSADDPTTGLILQDYNTFMRGLVSFFPLNVPGTPYARAIKARSNISLTFKGVIEKRKSGSCNKPAFIDLLLSNNELSDDDVITIVLGSLLAGFETTSVLISLAVYFISQSTKCLEQLKEEHERIRAGKGTEEFLSAEDYSKMEYTQLVLNETLRCGNVIKFVHRKALKDVRYKGYLIPAGWKILPIFSPVHLDPAFHVNPQQFEPCRWKVPDQKKSRTFTPFGGGLRLCPGSEIAKMEAAFFLHHLVLNYSWKLDGEDAPMAHAYVEFMRGLPIQIEPICDQEMK